MRAARNRRLFVTTLTELKAVAALREMAADALGAMALSRTTQFESWGGGLSGGQVALLAAYAVFMLGVCLLACVVPTRRALGVEPIVAMRAE